MSRAWLSGLGSQLRPCWDSVAASLTPLGAQLSDAARQCLRQWPGFGAQQEVTLNGRRLLVERLLGEGG